MMVDIIETMKTMVEQIESDHKATQRVTNVMQTQTLISLFWPRLSFICIQLELIWWWLINPFCPLLLSSLPGLRLSLPFLAFVSRKRNPTLLMRWWGRSCKTCLIKLELLTTCCAKLAMQMKWNQRVEIAVHEMICIGFHWIISESLLRRTS
jgi:hypothetical protein